MNSTELTGGASLHSISNAQIIISDRSDQSIRAYPLPQIHENYTPLIASSQNGAIYDVPRRRIGGGGIVKDVNGNWYTMLVAPYILSKWSSEFILLNEYDFSDLPGVIPWTPEKYQRFQRVTLREAGQTYLRNNITAVHSIYIIGEDEEMLLTHLKFWGERPYYIYHLITLEGELIAAFKSNLWLMAIDNDILYFYKERTGQNGISVEAYRYRG